MRFILGILVGVVLLTGTAYIHDASVDPVRNPSARVMVNWDVVTESVRGLSDWLHDQWTEITSTLHNGN